MNKMMQIYNFGAGPAQLPKEVIQQAQKELLNYNNSGISILEMGHRTNSFIELLQQAEQDFRLLLSIPDNYKVLFTTGPTRCHFAFIPMNLLGTNTTADYIDTGIWSHAAMEEAKRYCNASCASSTQASNYTTIEDQSKWKLNPKAAFVHYTANETINGVEFPFIPDVGDVPLVCDMTSNILSQPVDVSRFGMIYAGAQKNIATAGLTIIIIRDDLLERALAITPSTFHYKHMAETQSLYYTPNMFSCYIAALTFKWLLQQGGVDQMAINSHRKSQKFYNYIDQSNGFYINKIDKPYRSRMNVPFQIHKTELEEKFLQEAAVNGLKQLKGHQLIGGLRASFYNAMPESGVDALIAFMTDFQKRYG